jgi:hypothetical protein
MDSAPTVSQRIDLLRAANLLPAGGPLPTPRFTPTDRWTGRVFCGIASFERHTSDEGWQLQIGLQHAGYLLAGKNLPFDETDIDEITLYAKAGTLILQDKREWDPSNDACIDKSEAFECYEYMKDDYDDVFKLTICKDAHARPDYHRQASDEIGCHAWICYYHPDIVCALAPWIRREHVIRTWHSVDSAAVPPYNADDHVAGCLISGAVTRELYPFRTRIRDAHKAGRLKSTAIMHHPGYHARGSHTPLFLKMLSRHKVAICTASIFGYALRKIIEATACGCRVITDLPPDEILPGSIDGNLVRVSPDISIDELDAIVQQEIADYSPHRQQSYSVAAINWFDWRRRGAELAEAIERMRKEYPTC